MSDLAAFGLAVGDTVRWRRGSHGPWKYLTVRGVEKDGSLSLIGDNGFRALRPEGIQRKQHGPKGGVEWTSLQRGET